MGQFIGQEGCDLPTVHQQHIARRHMLDGGSRDAEYRAWSALRTARPAAGVYLDEVPLATAYARPGAWR